MQNAATRAIDWSEQGLVTDMVIRHVIKRLIKKRLAGSRSRFLTHTHLTQISKGDWP
jgi:hypothetical protein